MNKGRAFIPRNKPRSWVIGVLSSLFGSGSGLIAFVAAHTDLLLVKWISSTLFLLCWLVFAVSWIICFVGSITGRYHDIEDRDWKEQVW